MNVTGSGTATPIENVSGPPVAIEAFAASPIKRFGFEARIPFSVVTSEGVRAKPKPALPAPGLVDGKNSGGLIRYLASRIKPVVGSQSVNARLSRVMLPPPGCEALKMILNSLKLVRPSDAAEKT